jgi:hypothetical protein
MLDTLTPTDAVGWQDEGRKHFLQNEYEEASHCYLEVSAQAHWQAQCAVSLMFLRSFACPSSNAQVPSCLQSRLQYLRHFLSVFWRGVAELVYV